MRWQGKNEEEDGLPFLDELDRLSANGRKALLIIVDNCEDAMAAQEEDTNGLPYLVAEVILCINENFVFNSSITSKLVAGLYFASSSDDTDGK